MYVHAYQSYVWNAIVSERIRMFGCDKAVAGDLVFDKNAVTSASEGQNQRDDEEMDVDGDAKADAEPGASR